MRPSSAPATLQSAIPDLITTVSLGVIAWGLCFQAARALGYPFASLVPVSIAVAVIMLGGVAWTAGRSLLRSLAAHDRQDLLARALLLAAAVALAWLRSLDHSYGGDSLDYLATPGFFRVNPQEPLGFDARPFLDLGYTGVSGYWLPYTWEYLLAAWSLVVDVQLPLLAFSWLPAAGTAAAVLVFNALFRSFGARRWLALVLSASIVLMAFLDGNSEQAWGVMAFRRLFENKGLLFALGLPAILLLVHEATKAPTARRLLRLWALVTALCFITPNAFYLVPLAGTMQLLAGWLATPRAQRFSLRRASALVAALYTVPVVMLALVAWLGGPSVYDFLDAETFAQRRNDPFLHYSTHLRAVFGNQHPALWLGLGITAIALLKGAGRAVRTVAWLALFQALLVAGLPLFELIKSLGIGEYRVYWRFFLVLPVPVFMHLAIAALDSGDRRMPFMSAVAGFALACYALLSSGTNGWSVRFTSPRPYASLDREHRSLEAYAASGIQLAGKWILADRRQAQLMAVFSPGVRLLIGEPYFLAWQGALTGQRQTAVELARAQMFLGGEAGSERHAAAFTRVLQTFRPDAVILTTRRDRQVGQADLLEAQGYRPGPTGKGWRMYLAPAG